VNLIDFKKSLQQTNPPAGLDTLLLALWHDAQGNWDKSHNIVAEIDTKEGALVHAYLHRKEGDIWHADYWYRRAGEKRKDGTLEEEWEILVARLMA
jgi:hypothetical protein